MKLIIFTSALLLTTAAQGWQFPKVGAEGAIEEMHQHEWLEKHSHPARMSSNITRMSTDNIRTIDGREPVIEISDARTGLPTEYMAMPTSKKQMERYAGR